MNHFFKKLAVVAAFSGLFTASAMATPISLDMVWSGAPYGNAASARGTLVLDDSVLPDGHFAQFGPVTMNDVTSLELDVFGGSPGSYASHYTKTDFFFVIFRHMDSLDLSKELLGQILPNKCVFGTSRGDCGEGDGGDFNLISTNSPGPGGTYYFELTHPSGEKMLLTSLKKTGIGDVPEPASLALFGLALAGAAVVRRKKA